MEALAVEINVPLKPLSARKYRAILDAGKRVFLETGYADSSMERIAKEANVSKRTVYNHFSSKYELFCSVLIDLTRDVMPAGSQELQVDELPVKEALNSLSVHFLQTIYSPDVVALLRMVIAESRQFPELGVTMFDGVISRSMVLVEKYFKRKAEKGELALSDPKLATAQFIGLLKTDLQLKLLLGKRKRVSLKEIKKVADSCVDIFLCHATHSHSI